MTNKKTLLALLVPMFFGVACTTTEVAHHAPHWTYEGHTSAEHWGDMQSDFAECKLGKNQSPIDIYAGATEKANLAPIKPAYKSSAADLVNNGHTIQIDLTDAGGASLSNGDYKISQFHFHTPSEEKINGLSYPLVAHMVHKNAAGNLAVVAVLFKEGKENAALKDVFSRLPPKEGKAALATGFDPSKLLPTNLSYFSFTGSLTTPPCSEGVSWHVLKNPVEMSAAQINAFKNIYRMNARPVQPLNGRKVLSVGQ
jgi:carbonic anhydrase